MKQIFVPPLTAALLSLAACGGGDQSTPTGYCPTVAVLSQANNLTTYLPNRSDIAAQITTAKITGVAGVCQTIKKNALLKVKFQAGFAATNGPANNNAPITLPYFVSISQGDTIVSKTPYSITLNFNGNTSTASATSKPVTIQLSNLPAAANTDILVGFQLTPSQLSAASNNQP